MADIDVVKKGSKTWLWVVIALAIVLFLIFMMGNRGNSPAGYRMDGGQPHAAAVPAVDITRPSSL